MAAHIDRIFLSIAAPAFTASAVPMKVLVLVLVLFLALLGVARADSPLVIDGREAVKGEFPPLVSLQNRGNHFCGGSLVDSKTVLTAAHCFFNNRETAGLTVVAGVTNLRHTSDPDRRVYGVSRIIVHPDYQSSSHYLLGADVAVLKLSTPVVETHNIKFVKLPAQGEAIPPSGTRCQVAGWGAIDPSGLSSHTRQMVGDMHAITNEECGKFFTNTASNVQKFCTASTTTISSCRGDSGGPLFCNGVQYGAVSYGRVPCGQWGVPGVYARVATYRHWLDSNLN